MRAALLALLLALSTPACVLDWDAAWPGSDQGVVDRGAREARPEQDFLPPDALRLDTVSPPSPWVWVAGGAGSADILDLARTPDGGVVGVGLFTGEVTLDKSDYDADPVMSDVFVVKLGSDGAHKWHYVAKGSGQNRAHGVAVSPGGDIWVVGDFEKTIAFPRTSSPVSFTAKGEEDIFVARLSAKGELKMVAQAGDLLKDIAKSVVVLKDGTALVTGVIRHQASFPGTSGAITPKIKGFGRQVFLARFTPQGKAEWVETAGGLANDEVEALAVDSQERIYLAGYYTSKSFFFQGIPKTKLVGTGNSDIFVAQLTRGSSGLKVGYLKGSSGNGVTAQAWDLDVDAAGNAYVAGFQWGGPFSMGGKTLPVSTKANMFVASVDPTGKTRWLQGSSSFGGAAARGVAMGPTGTVLVVGHFTDDFAYPGVSTLSGRGDNDIAVLALAASTGKAHHFIGTGASKWDRAWSVRPGPSGSVLVGGGFSLTVGFNKLSKTSGGGTDGLIWRAILSSSGAQ